MTKNTHISVIFPITYTYLLIVLQFDLRILAVIVHCSPRIPDTISLVSASDD